MLFLLKLGSLQYAILKTVLSVISIVLWTNGNFDLSDVCKFITHTMKNSCMYMRVCIWGLITKAKILFFQQDPYSNCLLLK